MGNCLVRTVYERHPVHKEITVGQAKKEQAKYVKLKETNADTLNITCDKLFDGDNGGKVSESASASKGVMNDSDGDGHADLQSLPNVLSESV